MYRLNSTHTLNEFAYVVGFHKRRESQTERETTNLKLRRDIKKRANGSVENGHFNGITTLSGLVEKALTEILDKNNVP